MSLLSWKILERLAVAFWHVMKRELWDKMFENQCSRRFKIHAFSVIIIFFYTLTVRANSFKLDFILYLFAFAQYLNLLIRHFYGNCFFSRFYSSFVQKR